jgi:hypothetical protein
VDSAEQECGDGREPLSKGVPHSEAISRCIGRLTSATYETCVHERQSKVGFHQSPFRFFLSFRLCCQSQLQSFLDLKTFHAFHEAARIASHNHAAGSKQACISSLREVRFAQQQLSKVPSVTSTPSKIDLHPLASSTVLL